MVLGIIQYVAGGKYLGQAGLYVAEGQAKARAQLAAGMGALGSLVIVGLVLSRAGIFTPSATSLANAAGVLIALICLLYFTTVFTAGGLDGVERKRIGAVFILFIFSAVFWAGFEQAGSSLNLVARDLTDRVVFGREAPASWFQSVNSLFIISLAPVFAWIWVALARCRKEPSSPMKFAFGLIFVGAGFMVMVAATAIAAGGTRVSPMWLVLTMFLHTLGELCLSPVGLSTVTKLAPQRYVGQMMGVWFMSIALGNLMAGRVAGLFDSLPLPQLFGAVTAITAGAGLVLMLLVRPIRKLMVGVH
jgi:POT family proton-dependent oligopeptide transporter